MKHNKNPKNQYLSFCILYTFSTERMEQICEFRKTMVYTGLKNRYKSN